MKIAQQFTVARPLADVWAFFLDVPAVARCMPGAELTSDKGDGVYAGRVKAKLGPFGANFEGEARVTTDPATHSGHVEGKGVDKRGGSRTRVVMDYRLAAVEGGTRVTVDADVTLAGAIAQFGRTSLMQETANILVRDFASALEAQLTAPAAPSAAPAPHPSQVEEAAPGGNPAPAEASPAENGHASAAPPPGETATGAAPQSAVARTGAVAAAPVPTAAPQTAAVRAGAVPTATAAPQARPAAPAPQRELRAGSVGLRALWAWLKSLVRGLFSGSDDKTP